MNAHIVDAHHQLATFEIESSEGACVSLSVPTFVIAEGVMVSRMNTLLARAAYPLSIWLKTIALLSIPPVSRHRRRLIFGAFSSLRRKLPVVSIDEILAGIPDSEEVRLGVLETREHNMSLFEVFCLAAITRKFAPSVALEIGTYDGRSTMALARNMTGKVYTSHA